MGFCPCRDLGFHSSIHRRETVRKRQLTESKLKRKVQEKSAPDGVLCPYRDFGVRLNETLIRERRGQAAEYMTEEEKSKEKSFRWVSVGIEILGLTVKKEREREREGGR